jgi:hypothetical protein
MLMTELSLNELGPVDYLVVEFPAGASSATGEMAAAMDRNLTPDKVMQGASGWCLAWPGSSDTSPYPRKLRMKRPWRQARERRTLGKCPAEPSLKEAGMATRDQPGNGWTVVLRRRPARAASRAW